MNIAVIISVHNRIEQSVKCLYHLEDQVLMDENFVHVYIVDDGSSDLTSEVLQEKYSQATVIQGNGNLYWNQGMRLAWAQAAQQDYDAYLWLNNDTYLAEDAVLALQKILLEQESKLGRRGIAVGSCYDPAEKNMPTYGGYVGGKLVSPKDEPMEVEKFNGNLVLVSREAYQILGNLSAVYQHSFGDFDYGIRARAAQVPVWLAPRYLATCARNPTPAWLNKNIPLKRRLKALQSPKGISAKELTHFLRLQGVRLPFLRVLKLYATVLFPSLLAAGYRLKKGES